MRVCAACGREVPEPEARFCGFCGAPMSATGSAPTIPAGPGSIRARRPGDAAPVPRPVSRPTDSVSTTLQPSSVSADPGGAAAVSIRVRNTGPVVDELRITVEGPAAPWAEVESPVLRLMPGTDGTSAIRFKPPLVPLALAGPTAFVVRVQSHEHPDEAATEAGVLTVGDVRSLAAVIVPATAKARGATVVEVRVENRGNRPADVIVTATDPDEALRLDLDPGVQRIPPGGEVRSALRVTPRTPILLGATERRTFQVAVNSEGRTQAQATGTLIQAARLPSWAPMAGAAVVVAALLAIGGVALGVIPPKSGATPSPEAGLPGTGNGPVVASQPPSAPPSAGAPSTEPSSSPSASEEPPTDAPTPTPTPAAPPVDACVNGYAWRQITPVDHVCVTPQTVEQVRADNAVAASRWVQGDFGPHTCVTGYVWRVASDADDVCVTVDVRTLTAFDNQAGPNRVAPRDDTCVAGYVWREATPDDHVCVEDAVRAQVIADNLQAPLRWTDGAYGPQTCVSGYVWRVVVESDLVCVTPDVRDQAQLDNAAAGERIAPQ